MSAHTLVLGGAELGEVLAWIASAANIREQFRRLTGASPQHYRNPFRALGTG